MERAASIPRPLAASDPFPPGSRLPGIVQGLRYARDPLGFFIRLQRRYGDIFSVRFPYFGRVVYVADPELVKQVFTGDPAQFHAGEANATVLEPALGPNSVLTLDDGDAHAPAQAAAAAVPRRAGAPLRRADPRDHRARRWRRWPVGEPFALRPHTQRITLAVILRAVFGRPRRRALRARFGG